jgi:hypothetical protein
MLLLSGCSSSGPDNFPATVDATGKITLDGKALERAQIVLIPDGGEYGAQAMSQTDGSFQLKAFQTKPGAVPGLYKVRVARTVEVAGKAPTAEELGEDAEHMTEKDKAGVGWINDLPQKYANPASSGIVIEIPPEGVNDLQIELVSD